MRLIRMMTIMVALAASSSAFGQGTQWVTLKGEIKLSKPPEKLKVGEKIEVSTDKDHCLSKGDLVSEIYVVNPKNKGLKNVVVYLRPELIPNVAPNAKINRLIPFKPEEINPALAAAKPKEHVIDQPCCQFEPRCTVAREGDTLIVKNSAPVNHNFKYDSENNGSNNWNTPSGQSQKFQSPLKAESRGIAFECNVHPWMRGKLWVFDHPYFALTDADGKFVIKDAPVGKYRLVLAHEGGSHKGTAWYLGEPIEIKPGPDNTMEVKTIEYEFPK